MAILYSSQAYQELKQQTSSRSNTTALDLAVNDLKDVVNKQFQLAGIRWTADIEIREAIDNVRRLCRQLHLEKDTALEESMNLKERIHQFEKKDADQAKRSREQQSEMVQSIKLRAEKERKQLDRKYKLKLKEDEQKILDQAKADYLKTSQELAEKMSVHLKQVEDAYLVACQAQQRQLEYVLDQFRASFENISQRVLQEKAQSHQYLNIIELLQKQLSEVISQLTTFQIEFLDRPLCAQDTNSHVSFCISKLLEGFEKKQKQIRDENRQFHDSYIQQHTTEIQEINLKVKDVIERKDRKISQMKEAIDSLNAQLTELTALPALE